MKLIGTHKEASGEIKAHIDIRFENYSKTLYNECERVRREGEDMRRSILA
jgi:hypothetical protein